MNDDSPWYENAVLPGLLRHARYTYGAAMREALTAAGFDDIPPSGMYIIGTLALRGGRASMRELVGDLGVSKQATSELVDTLVSRGYVERAASEEDRRQLLVTLTERGREAARTQAEVRDRIDATLLERVGEEAFRSTRRTLAALIEMRRGAADSASANDRGLDLDLSRPSL
jgi:DNA-binding MarR family transcriptional regulator